MKRRWISLLLVTMLSVLLAMTSAIAEASDEIDLSLAAEEMGIYSELVGLDIPEEFELELSMVQPLDNDFISDDTFDEDPTLQTDIQTTLNSFIDGDYDHDAFEIDEEGVLISYHGDGGIVVIPSGVKIIGDYAFYRNSYVTGVTIPYGVTSIGDYAFNFCENLSSIDIPNSLTEIGYCAFKYSGLRSVTIPDSVTFIDRDVFGGCVGLTSASLSTSMTYIPFCMFDGCTNLKSITIPNSVIKIEEYAFRNTGLTSITLSDNITTIEGFSFSSCHDLTSVTIGKGVTNIGRNAFDACNSLTSISIPSNVKELGVEIFRDCSQLKSVTLSKGITKIGGGSFLNCVSLTSVTIPYGVTEISGLFQGCSSLTSVSIPDSITAIHCNSFKDCISLAEITIPDKVTSIDDGWSYGETFRNCTSLKSIVIPNGVHAISFFTFADCTNLAKITIPSSVTSIDTTVFDGHGSQLKILGETGSYAESYAKENDIQFQAIVTPTPTPKIPLSKCAITGITDAVYTGKAIKPAPVVKYKGKKLKKGTDYTVSYKNNKNIGTATVTITGKGKYGASINKTFKINPKPVTLSSLTAGSKQLTVKWKKGSSITGYEIQYSLKSNFKSAKKVTISKASTTKTILKKLKASKSYYVRIRTYKTVKGKKYYSTWSKVKSAKPTK